MDATVPSAESEVAILARVLSSDKGKLSEDLARHMLDLEFSVRDKERMHDLAVRNQRDELSDIEKDELIAYAKAGTLLSILKSKARRSLKSKPKNGEHT